MERSIPSSSTPLKTERRIIEKNRRTLMKNLYSKLNSLLPTHPTTKEPLPLSDQIEEAVKYIKSLEKNLEKSKEKKDYLSRKRPYSFTTSTASLKSPQIEICKMGPDLDVVFLTGLQNQFTFYEIIRLIQEEGAEVVNASFSVLGSSTLHLVHPKIGESAAALNYGASRLSERLKMLVCGSGGGEVESQPDLWDSEIQSDIWEFDFPQLLPKGV